MPRVSITQRTCPVPQVMDTAAHCHRRVSPMLTDYDPRGTFGDVIPTGFTARTESDVLSLRSNNLKFATGHKSEGNPALWGPNVRSGYSFVAEQRWCMGGSTLANVRERERRIELLYQSIVKVVAPY